MLKIALLLCERQLVRQREIKTRKVKKPMYIQTPKPLENSNLILLNHFGWAVKKMTDATGRIGRSVKPFILTPMTVWGQ